MSQDRYSQPIKKITFYKLRWFTTVSNWIHPAKSFFDSYRKIWMMLQYLCRSVDISDLAPQQGFYKNKRGILGEVKEQLLIYMFFM